MWRHEAYAWARLLLLKRGVWWGMRPPYPLSDHSACRVSERAGSIAINLGISRPRS